MALWSGRYFCFGPYNLWETLGMASSPRKLEFHKNAEFTGWSCTACGWVQPLPRIVQEDIETEFASHECSKYPRPLNSEDFS